MVNRNFAMDGPHNAHKMLGFEVHFKLEFCAYHVFLKCDEM